MKLRKMSAICLAVILAVVTIAVPISAAENISSVKCEINESFEGYSSTGAPNGWIAYGVWDGQANGTFTPVPESIATGKSGKGIKIALTSGQYTAGIQKSFGGTVASDEYLDIEFDVKPVNETSYPVLRLTDDGAGEQARIRFKNGEICQGDKSDAPAVARYTAKINDWSHIKLRINGYNSSYEVWVDGVQAVNNGVYTYDGLKDYPSGSAIEGNLKKQNLIAKATTLLLGVYQEGECHYDNVKVVRSKRENFRNSTIFETDFSDLTQGYKQIPDNFVVPCYYWGVGGNKVDDAHGMSLALSEDYISGIGYKFDKRVTSGTVAVEFDAYKDLADGNTGNVGLMFCPINNASTIDGWRNDNGGMWLAADKDGQFKFREGDTTAPAATANDSWHRYKLVVDLTDKTQEIFYDGVSAGKQTTKIDKYDGIRVWAFSGSRPTQSGNVVNIDNFKVTITPSAVSAYTEENQFNDYSTIDDIVGAGKVFYKESWSASSPEYIKEGDNGYIRFHTETGNASCISKEIPETSKGVVRYSGSIMVKPESEGGSSTPIATILVGSNDSPTWTTKYLFAIQNETITIGAINGGNITGSANKWYDVVATIDLTAQTANIKVTCEGQEVAEKTLTDINVPNIKWVRFHQGGTGSTGSACFDNFKVEILGEALKGDPTVAFYNTKNENIDISNSMDTDIEKITVDFGASMDSASLIDAVSLVDSSGKEVGYNANVDDGLLTLNLTNLLSGNETYTLNIANTAKTAAGMSISQAVETSFGTGDAKMKADGFVIKAGDTEVRDITTIKSGAQVRINCSYINTLDSNNELYLVLCWYRDGTLTTISYKEVTLDSVVRAADISLLEDIPADADANTFRAFLWRGNEKMIPVTNKIELK